MKKNVLYFYIAISLFIFQNLPIYANDVKLAEISKLENNLYGFNYDNDNIEKRLNRLEQSIYGKTYTGNVNKRISNISNDLFSELIGQEITPAEDSFNSENEIADNSANYPIVDEIEMKLFNQTYRNRDFHTRIVTIERKLFGKIYDIDDYSTRMDRIKAEIMPSALATDPNRFNYNNAMSSDELSGISQSRFSGRMPWGQRNYTRPYTNYGEYNDRIFDSNDDDLAQLEYNTFGTEFSNDDTKTRLKRLNSVNKAKKSSRKYDSQKFQQHMSAAMEIGAMILMILAMVL